MSSLFRPKQCVTIVISLFFSIVSTTVTLKNILDNELVALESSVASTTGYAEAPNQMSDAELDTPENSIASTTGNSEISRKRPYNELLTLDSLESRTNLTIRNAVETSSKNHPDTYLDYFENGITSTTGNVVESSHNQSDKELETLESSVKAIQNNLDSSLTDNGGLFKLYHEAQNIENQLMERKRTTLSDIFLTKVHHLQESTTSIKMKIRDGIILPMNKEIETIKSELKAVKNIGLSTKSGQLISALKRKLGKLQRKLSSMESAKEAVEVSESLASIAVDVAFLKDSDKGPSYGVRLANRVSMSVSRLKNFVRDVVRQFFG